MRRGPQYRRIIRSKEIGTGGPPLSARNLLEVASIDIHRVDLIAGVGRSITLENELLAVIAPVRLSILRPIGQLDDVGEMVLSRMVVDHPR